MNKMCITEAIDAMETAYTYILCNVNPGTPGKVKAATDLKHQVDRLVYEYAHHNRNHNELPDSIAA